MPNHVTTICTVTGIDQILNIFASSHFPLSEEKDEAKRSPHFDFRTVIPMPQSIKNTIRDFCDPIVPEDRNVGDGAIEEYAISLMSNRRTFILNRPAWIPADVKKHGDFITWMDRTNPRVGFWARRSLIAAAETGSAGWYEWSIENWATKWGGYDYELRSREPGKLVFKFETAWSFPEPIFRKLAEMYPALVFAVVSYDEGSNFACSGEFNGKNDYVCGKATPELYEAVYGSPQPTYDEDGEEIESAVSP